MIPRRWVVERSLAWLTAHRRLARDDERHPATSAAMIRRAASNGMVRRLTRGRPAARQRAWPPRRPQGLTLLKHALGRGTGD